MKIEDHPTFEQFQYVASNLRPLDWAELAVTRDPRDFIALAVDAWLSERSWVALTDDQEPAMAFGWHRFSQDSAQLWGFATLREFEVLRGVTKHLVRVIVPSLPQLGIDRTFCFVHPDNTRSRRWLAFLGLRPEATVSDLGPERKGSLILYARGHHARDHPSPSHRQDLA